MFFWIFLILFFVTKNTFNSDLATSSYSISFVIIKRPSYIILYQENNILKI